MDGSAPSRCLVGLFVVSLLLITSTNVIAEARALAIGVNKVNPQAYAPVVFPEIPVCEADAMAMAKIATENNFLVKSLLGPAATVEAVKSFIEQQQAELKDGDIFVISYSGHGSFVRDDETNGSGDEFADQVWCLFDGQLLDDELALLWKGFAKGVRIVMYSDSCHSGTIIKVATEVATARGYWVKGLSPDDQAELTPKWRSRWEGIPSSVKSLQQTKAAVISLSACTDFSKAYAIKGASHSLFTKHLLATWREGQFNGSYVQFLAAIRPKVMAEAEAQPDKLNQDPQFNIDGTNPEKLQAERPWTN